MNQIKRILPQNICIALLPFWSPVIPPPGILSIRNYLKKFGYDINIVDFNTKACFRKIPIDYFNMLKQIIPEEKLKDLSVVGFHVLRNHLMINQNCSDKSERMTYLREVLEKNFYTSIKESGLEGLDEIIVEFYRELSIEINSLINMLNPHVLGFSVYEDTLPASLYAFKIVKKSYPKILTIMGGGVFHDILKLGSSNFEYLEKNTVKFIDKIVVGEGELFFKDLLDGTLDLNKRVYINHNTQVEAVSFEEVDYTDFIGIDLRQYPYLYSFASRSCPFKCKFCTEQTYSGPYRTRNTKDVAAEINHMIKGSNKDFIFFTDLLLNPIINELSEELGNLSRPCFWEGYLRADRHLCTEENAIRWRNAGFAKAMIGVESGSERILKLMDKRIDLQHISETLINLANAGIKTTVFVIVGYPGETEEDFNDSLQLISKLESYIYEVYSTPFYFYPDKDKKSSEWDDKLSVLYKQIPQEILFMQTYTMENMSPLRQVTYERLHRMVDHCEKYGIKPNRFAYDIYNADKRWKRLHGNASPSVFGIL